LREERDKKDAEHASMPDIERTSVPDIERTSAPDKSRYIAICHFPGVKDFPYYIMGAKKASIDSKMRDIINSEGLEPVFLYRKINQKAKLVVNKARQIKNVVYCGNSNWFKTTRGYSISNYILLIDNMIL
jgi:hypothetical protein